MYIKNGLGIASIAFNELVDDMEIESFSENEKQEMLSKLTEVVTKRVFVEAMERLGSDGRIEYEKMVLDEKSQDEIMNFISSKIKNFDDLVTEVIEKIREEMSLN